MSSTELEQYKQLIEEVKHFRGADAYILDVVARISALPPKVRKPKVLKQSDVAALLSDLSLHRL